MPELRGRALMLTISVLTSLGFMLIGYDNGLMGGLVGAPAFNKTFDSPSSDMIGTIVAIFEIGCFLGAMGTAVVGEKLGRRKSIAIGAVVSVIGAVLQASAFGRAHLIVGRIVSGVGLGIINSTVPVLQAEFSPKASRGIYVCAQLSTLNFGIFLVYWIDYGFVSHTSDWAWRIPTILQCLILLTILGLLTLIPETPRWLAAHDRPDECLQVLARVADVPETDAEVQRLHTAITETVAFEASRQADYSGTLFEKSIGFDTHMASLMSGFLQTWFFVASFIPWFLIDRVGRRPLLLSMISVMAAVMAVQSGLIYQVQYKTSTAKGAGIAAAAMLFVFQGAFTIGFQATVWVYPSEILPLRLRQRGSAISTAANWICNYIIVQITPHAISNIGWKTYIIFAVLNALWVPIIFFFFPETKGLELEDVDLLFSGEVSRTDLLDKDIDEERVENVADIKA
ncbi:sugar transporter stl1 [Stemphylium lycopersici]|uniref:Sugar transporter stl1 n=1 Tax=Stemphylium lycopersici TaxID=183478 RepID=A0A364NFJ3_STELY|nr:sugar transporter stl1 [Stemphylium lycopersici]RAQ98915.1 sugar transporter stl1 [Stemphylium lycopersici]RAR15881.1 sugar transporter stl1 [Stemphylium lycopersici]